MMVAMSYVESNRAHWDALAADYARAARALWAQPEPTWGNFHVPQSQVPMLPADIAGADVLELGCGTGYVSAWAARAGAKPVGLDNSARQLATARGMQDEFGIPFPLVHADGERPPFQAGRFDLVISEYGASIWCDPHRWLPEAARLLRPGGRLVFLRNSSLLVLCLPPDAADPGLLGDGTAGTRLHRDQFGPHRMASPDGSVEFHPPHGEWIALLRSCGFVLDELVEVAAPAEAVSDFGYVTAEWGRRWPAEEVWKAHLP